MEVCMTTPFLNVAPWDPQTKLVHVIIDTPRGSRNKFKFDEKLGCFTLSRILPVGHVFPYDFGSIPGTRGEDGDALDVLVIMDEPTFPGCLITVRLVGVIVAFQTEKGRRISNDRLIGVPQTKVNKPTIRDISDLGAARLKEIEHFFVSYNAAKNRRFTPFRRLGAIQAQRILRRGIAASTPKSGA
jgi:inorganic pyrophosphatase